MNVSTKYDTMHVSGQIRGKKFIQVPVVDGPLKPFYVYPPIIYGPIQQTPRKEVSSKNPNTKMTQNCKPSRRKLETVKHFIFKS